MKSARKVALLSTFWNGKIQQILRGALRYADTHPLILAREFRSGREGAPGPGLSEASRALSDWAPDGVLAILDDAGIEGLLRALGPTPPPVVNCLSCRRFPGVTEVVGSMADLVARAVEHFRQLGLRSLGFVSFDEGGVVAERLRNIVGGIVGRAELGRAFLEAPVAEALLANYGSAVTPVPKRIAEWLRGLPKPAGVLAIELGAGGYVIRACKALGLRVPEDVAIIGGCDDTDACLANDPPLTSVGVSGDTLGFGALEILDRVMAGAPAPEGAVAVKGAELHVRQSTGQRRAEICDIAAATEYIRKHACHGINVEEVSKATQGVSKRTFHKHFEAVTGTTPGEAIRARQFEEARRLLASTELSMSLVAEMSGFSSANDFARSFRVTQGISPTAYRQRERKG